MDVREVHALVQAGRAIKSPTYHPGKRGIGFLQILAALERCYRVSQDSRSRSDGAPAHPDGWYALANLPNRRRLRVDFDVSRDEAGNLLLIVTAYDA
ncbi:MAG: hypothetical protein LC623_00590 [Halobacteriales archaeon]|nr:hypothetical protein [Halobacteriales archaeon]